MNTKNLLKIGVLSIILLSLLISPVLKYNSLKVMATTECEEKDGICISSKAGQKCSDLEMKESDLSCVGADGKNQCCVPSDSDYAKPLESEKEEYYIKQEELKKESQTDITGTAKELPVTEICEILVYGEKQESKNGIKKIWSWLTGDGDDKWWQHKVCVFQLGMLEGIGKMIGGMINSLTAKIFWALNPDTYGGFVKNIGVVKVWTILKNFMNLALILILVVIAISTILGIKKYRWQEILWKLALVALLINFSLIIPGVLLDISHFITYVFINLTQNLNNESIPQTIINKYLTDEISGSEKYAATFDDTQDIIKLASKGEKLPEENKDIKMSKEGWGLAWGNFFLVLAALALIGLFAFISLIAIFFAMMFRSFMIIILLAVSPIAFAALVLPNTEKYWQLWWGHFTRWCLFPITFAVSLYAGIIVLNEMSPLLDEMRASNENLGIIAMLVQITLFSMFLIGGLIVSIQSGGAVAQIVQKQVGRAGWIAGSLAGRKIKGAITESQTYKKTGKFLTKVPLLGVVGQEMMVAGEKAKAGRVKEYEKNLENVGLGNLKELEKNPAPSPLDRSAYERRIALTNKLAGMGELGAESVEFIKKHMGDKRFDASAITKAIPHHFKLEEGQLVKTGDLIKDKVDALSRIKPDKIRDKTQASDFIKDIMKERKAEAEKQGKSAKEIKDAENKAFEETIQTIVKTLSPAQMAGLWEALSPKDLIEKGWGGTDGKIVQAIKKDDQAEKRFYNELLPFSSALREFSGIKRLKVEKKQDKKTGETPPHPG